MTRNRNFERIESRISSGLADVFASAHDDPFPEVPQHVWHDPTLDRHSHGDAPSSSHIYVSTNDLPSRPQSGLDTSASAPRRGYEDELTFHDDALREETFSRDISREILPHREALVSSGEANRANVNSSTNSSLSHFTAPWLHLQAPSHDGLASSETLRGSDNDEWFYLEQIANYLDTHQKTPIDAHTGFNYVDGLTAARALGLADLDDNQTMILMRAGLMVHHYASSATPWRDALSAVEYESQMEARHEVEREKASCHFKKGRLMNQMSEATTSCDYTILRKYLWLWRVNFIRACETNHKLLTFDEQTLLLPYFDGWSSQKEHALQRLVAAKELSMRRVSATTVHVFKEALAKQKKTIEYSRELFKTLSLRNTIATWSNHAKKRSEQALLAVTNENATLMSKCFNLWRTRKAQNVLKRRSESRVIEKITVKWRLLAKSNQECADKIPCTKARLPLNRWRRELKRVRELPDLSVEASAIVLQNHVRFLFRNIWLGGKIDKVSRDQQARMCALYIRMWRTKTRLLCYTRIKGLERVAKVLESWRSALREVFSANEITGQICLLEKNDLQSRLLHLLQSRTSERIATLEPKMKLADNIVFGKHGFLHMALQVKRSRDLSILSDSYFLRSILRKVKVESHLRRDNRLEVLTGKAASLIRSRDMVKYFRVWRLRTHWNAVNSADLEIASQYGDCEFAIRKWLEVFGDLERLELLAEEHYNNAATSNTLIRWKAKMSDQIEAEINAETQVTLRRGLLAKRILRSWRRQCAFVQSKVTEWREDADRQLAVIYFRTMHANFERRRHVDLIGGSGITDNNLSGTISSPQRTPSRRYAISPRALEVWTARNPTKNNKGMPKLADEWGATPLSRRTGVSSGMMSTPTKPSRLMRDLKLEPRG